MPIGVSLKNRRVGRGDASVVIPGGNTAERPVRPFFGSIRFNVDTGRVEFFDGVTWRNLSLEGVLDTSVTKFVGDGIDTTFGPLPYTVTEEREIIVFVGNVWQAPVDNYDIDVSNNIILPVAPALGVEVHVVKMTVTS